MKILVTGGTGLIGKAIQEISKEYIDFEFIFLSSVLCDLTKFNITSEENNDLRNGNLTISFFLAFNKI
jgi:dTDP-4-dehydrorhamnose reductase